MADKLTVQDWVKEIDRGLKYREIYGLEKYWHELEALFYGVHPSQAHEGPNIIAETGDALVSTLTVPSPYVEVVAKLPELVDLAPVLESLDNSMIKDTMLRSAIEGAVLDAYLWGKGVIKVGYDSEFGWDPSMDFGLGMSLSQFNSTGERIEFSSARPGFPWVKKVLPHDIVVPWGTIDDSDARWIAHRVVRHIDEVKADSKYSNTSEMMPTMSMEDFVNSYKSTIKPYRAAGGNYGSTVGMEGTKSREFVELWEIHDRATGKVVVISTGYNQFLRDEVDALQVRGLPFISFSLTPSARAFWTTSDAFYLRHAQAELSDISLQTSKQRRASILKFLYRSGAFTEEALNRLMSKDVGAGIEVAAGMDLDSVVKPITPQNVNLSLQQDSEFVRRNARSAVGMSRNQMGEFEQSGRRTAYEAGLVQQGAELRMSRRQVVVRDVYIEAVRKMNEMVFQFWTSPRFAKILDERGVPMFVAFTGRNLRGEYSYDLTFTQEPNMTPAERAQQAIMLYQGLVQDPAVDQIKLRQFLINNMVNNNQFRQVFNPKFFQQGGQNANISLPMQGGSPNGGVPGGQGQAGIAGVPGVQTPNGIGNNGNQP